MAGGAAFGLLGAAGCGADPAPSPAAAGSEPANASSPSSASSASAEAAYPVTIEHRHGRTEVRRYPERLMLVGLRDIDPVLALGAVPVGLRDWYDDPEYPLGVWPWAQELLGDARPTVLPRNEDKYNFEAIAAVRPDLILGMYIAMSAEEYATLSSIAPTVAPSGDFPEYGMPWEEETRTIGRALGRPQRAEELIAGVEDRFAEARRQHPDFEGRTAFSGEKFDPTNFYVRKAINPRTKFLVSLGFELAPAVASLPSSDEDGAEVSPEQLDLLDCDLALWNTYEPGDRAEIEDHPVYRQLDMAREGRSVYLTDKVESGALVWSTVLSIPFGIEAVVPKLVAALDGDPVTEVPE
ncbi:MAG: ABC transporter substrate-binding protein [Acidimicrobiia bacterium]